MVSVINNLLQKKILYNNAHNDDKTKNFPSTTNTFTKENFDKSDLKQINLSKVIECILNDEANKKTYTFKNELFEHILVLKKIFDVLGYTADLRINFKNFNKKTVNSIKDNKKYTAQYTSNEKRIGVIILFRYNIWGGYTKTKKDDKKDNTYNNIIVTNHIISMDAIYRNNDVLLYFDIIKKNDGEKDKVEDNEYFSDLTLILGDIDALQTEIFNELKKNDNLTNPDNDVLKYGEPAIPMVENTFMKIITILCKHILSYNELTTLLNAIKDTNKYELIIKFVHIYIRNNLLNKDEKTTPRIKDFNYCSIETKDFIDYIKTYLTENTIVLKTPEHKVAMTEEKVAEKHRQADANECDMVSAINNLFDKYRINREYIKEDEVQSSIFPKKTEDIITQFDIIVKPEIVINLNNFIRFSTFTTAATITNTLFKQILVLEEICTCLGFTTKLYINFNNIDTSNIHNINAYNHKTKGKNITKDSNRIGFIQLSTYGIWNVLKKKTDAGTFEKIQFKYKKTIANTEDTPHKNTEVKLDNIKHPWKEIIFLFDIIKKTDAKVALKTQQQVLHSVLTIINVLQDNIITYLTSDKVLESMNINNTTYMLIKSKNVRIKQHIITIIKSLIYNILSHKELLHIYDTIKTVGFNFDAIFKFIYTYIENELNKYKARNHDNTLISLFTCINTTKNFYNECFTERKESVSGSDEAGPDDEAGADNEGEPDETVLQPTNPYTAAPVVVTPDWGASV